MILSILNSSLLRDQESARLTADIASGSSTLTVDNISGYSVGKYILIGNFGEPTAEIIRIHASTAPSGSTITLASNTVQDHYAGSPVTVIDYNQVEFSNADTLTSAKSVLSTVSISADRLITIYDDLTNSSGFGFSRFKNSADTTYSAYSDGVNYTGSAANSFGEIAQEACSLAGVELGSDYAKESELYRDYNACHREIAQAQDWSFEIVNDLTNIGTTVNENEFSLSGLDYSLKHNASNKSIIDVRIGNSSSLDYLSPDDMDREMEGVTKGTLASAVSASDTSVTLSDSNEFKESGTITLGSNTGVAYTANDQSTGILSGISSSSITAAVASGSSVWQGINPGLPTKYTIIGNKIVFNVPVSSTYAGRKVKIRYLKKLDDATTFGTETDVNFFNAIPLYIAYRIETRKRNFDVANDFYQRFMEILEMNKTVYGAPLTDGQSYYDFNYSEYYGQD